MRKRYSRSYTVLSFLTMFSYRELPSGRPVFAYMIYMIPDFSLLAAMAAFSLRAG